MPTPINIDEFLELVRKSEVIEDKRLTAYLEKVRATSALPAGPNQLATLLVRDGLLTHFQAEQLLAGRWKRFTIGKYKVLERLGAGGMGSVYLCEHKLMRRRVAVKVLPSAKADDSSSLERFYREARAVAALDHPNIVRAYDIDQDDKLHFLVMEHVDGSSLQEIIKKAGPMDPLRAAHYMRQAAAGLQHAHETAGLVHRDIKPGNILVDRNGIVKVLDMGLARFFHDEDDILTKKYDETVLGTADYLAPEQALDSHAVDIRADIYSLGATFYYCLTGRTPFSEGTVAQKLIWHQTRQPKAIRGIRPEVPEELVAIIEKMMSKDPEQRYQTPQGVVDALAPFTQMPIAPPPEVEMPQLSLAAMGSGPGESSFLGTRPGSEPSPPPRKTWQVNAPMSAAAPVPTPPIEPRKAGATPAPPPTQTRAVPAPVAKALSSLPLPASNGPLRQPTPTMPAMAKQAIAAPAPVAPVEEEPSWDKLAPATDVTHRGDTSPRSSRMTRSSSHSTRSRSSGKKPPANRNLVWVAVGVATVVVLVSLALVLWLALRSPNVPQDSTTAPGRPPLVYSTTGETGTFKSLQQAIDKAGVGDKILLKGHVQESVTLAGKTGLVIEVDREITWQPPSTGFPPNTALTKLLTIHDCEDCKITGIKFDGKGLSMALIYLFGNNPGLTLDGLKLHNYTKEGILVQNAAGSSEKPIVFSRLEFSANAAEKATAPAIQFQIVPHLALRKNRFFTIRDGCFAEGQPLRIVKEKSAPLEDFKYPPTVKVEEK